MSAKSLPEAFHAWMLFPIVRFFYFKEGGGGAVWPGTDERKQKKVSDVMLCWVCVYISCSFSPISSPMPSIKIHFGYWRERNEIKMGGVDWIISKSNAKPRPAFFFIVRVGGLIVAHLCPSGIRSMDTAQLIGFHARNSCENETAIEQKSILKNVHSPL